MRLFAASQKIEIAKSEQHAFAAFAFFNIYWRLIRPGLLSAVLFSMAIAALTAAEPPAWTRLSHAMLGTALLIAGATALNQLLERRQDAQMTRTASRPLPSGRLTARQAAMFGAFASLAGVGCLAALQSPALVILAVLSWGIYVLLYTPLKRISVWHMPLGAVAGAMPVLLGTATADSLLTTLSLTLAGIVFFWQFPHTAAIGWLYRDQYARSEIKVAAVVDPSGRLTGRLAIFGVTGLLLTSLIPAALSMTGWLYFAIALSLGLTHMAVAAKFCCRPSDANARMLWRMSLVHLPTLLASLLILVLCQSCFDIRYSDPNIQSGLQPTTAPTDFYVPQRNGRSKNGWAFPSWCQRFWHTRRRNPPEFRRPTHCRETRIVPLGRWEFRRFQLHVEFAGCPRLQKSYRSG